MYKNQLQELAQRSCFNLPSYSCIREGPDHAPRFKSTVNFNGEIFESPNFCTTLRQAEHSAAEVALNSLSHRGPSHSLAARILDETGVYKNLLQEIAQRVGAPLPLYTTFRSGLGHLPVFTCTVELAGIIFTGEPAKNKKQAEKNAAMAAWSSLKQLAKQAASSSSETENNDEQEQITIARALLNYRLKEKLAMADSPNAPSPFPRKFPMQTLRSSSSQPPPLTTSRILPLIRPKSAQRNRHAPTSTNDSTPPSRCQPTESRVIRPQKFPAAGAAPYIPMRHLRTPYHGVASPVTIRTAVPVFSAPPLTQSSHRPPLVGPQPVHISPPVCIRQAVPVFSAAPVRMEESPVFAVPPPPAKSLVQIQEPPAFPVPPPPAKSTVQIEEQPVSAPTQPTMSPVQIKEQPVFPIPPQPAKSPDKIKEHQVFPIPPRPAKSPVQIKEPPVFPVLPPLAKIQIEKPSVPPVPSRAAKSPPQVEESEKTSGDDLLESSTVQDFKQLKI